MIKHELHIVWICSDGEKFVEKIDALAHEGNIRKAKRQLQQMKDMWKKDL